MVAAASGIDARGPHSAFLIRNYKLLILSHDQKMAIERISRHQLKALLLFALFPVVATARLLLGDPLPRARAAPALRDPQLRRLDRKALYDAGRRIVGW